jgi:hypothetical protein
MQHPHFANMTNLQSWRRSEAPVRSAMPRASLQQPGIGVVETATFLHQPDLPKSPDAASESLPMSLPLPPFRSFRPRPVRGFCSSGPGESSHTRGCLGLNTVKFHIATGRTTPAHGPLHFTSHTALPIELRHDTSVPFGPGPKPATYPPLGVRRRAAIRRALRSGELATHCRNPDRTS